MMRVNGNSIFADAVGIFLILLAAAGFAFAGLSQWIALIVLSLGAFIVFPSKVKDYINTVGEKLPSIGIFKKKG